MTIILCAYCPWQGPHLRALWEHLAQKHGYPLSEQQENELLEAIREDDANGGIRLTPEQFKEKYDIP